MNAFESGVARAAAIIGRAPQEVDYWHARARIARRRWLTRLVLRRKRRFLDGFIAEFENHFKRQPVQAAPSDEQVWSLPEPRSIALALAPPEDLAAPAEMVESEFESKLADVSEPSPLFTNDEDPAQAAARPAHAGAGWSSATEKMLARRQPREWSVKLPSSLEQALSTSRRS